VDFDGVSVDPTDPNGAWRMLAHTQSFLPTDPASLGADALRVVCISDTHAKHADLDVPNGDILLHAGHLTSVGMPEDFQAFEAWMSSLPHRHKIVIAGNHDVLLDPAFYERNWSRFHREHQDPCDTIASMRESRAFEYLEDTSVTLLGYRFHGSPWQPEFYNWAFNLERGEACAEAWRRIPSDVDILITHGPPLGRGDKTSTGERAGCVNLLYEVQQRIRPLYHVFGHIHEGHGTSFDGRTHFVNACSCTLQYDASNPPLVFALPRRV
jgi:hypothetical protein